MSHLRALSFDFPVNDEALQRLAAFPQLRLYGALRCDGVSDEGLRLLGNMPEAQGYRYRGLPARRLGHRRIAEISKDPRFFAARYAHYRREIARGFWAKDRSLRNRSAVTSR
jgi:hypothetical protein